jgi:TetR/AcrR family acrAB operon transcriptional repressor
MARKTKAEAALTRDRIVACARQVFSRDGVTNTSLEKVAKEAGVTRGAVYWHFKNKADLFMAVRLDAGSLLRLSQEKGDDPLHRLELFLLEAIRRLGGEDKVRETYELMLWRCEYVGEFATVRDDLMASGRGFIDEVTALYGEARSAGLTDPRLDPAVASRETFCLYAGILKAWLAAPPQGIIRDKAEAMLRQHVALRRISAGVGLTPSADPRKRKA